MLCAILWTRVCAELAQNNNLDFNHRRDVEHMDRFNIETLLALHLCGFFIESL